MPGWDFRARRDSTRAYVARADSGLAVEIAMSSFVPDSAGASLAGVASNLKAASSAPFRLTVEFLDAASQVVASSRHDVPAVAPRQSHPFELQGQRQADRRLALPGFMRHIS